MATPEHTKNLEMKKLQKQMGCMAGFLHIFDRQHILTGKRIYSPKRLTPSPVTDTTSESEISSAPPSPKELRSVDLPPPIPIPESKEGVNKPSWKFRKEAPRLSLDSRATTDAKGGLHPKEIRITSNTTTDGAGVGNQHNRSPSVIARLMGLETLTNSESEAEKKPELRRSASESRVSRDLFHSRFSTDGANCYAKLPVQPHCAADHQSSYTTTTTSLNNRAHKVAEPVINKGQMRTVCSNSSTSSSSPWRGTQNRKSFFDSGDVFPDQVKQSVSIYGEIEKRLRMRGIDEPSHDLETLKQILEAMQLKGLLHSSKQQQPQQLKQQNHIRHRNFVYDDSPIVVMKPSRSPVSTPPVNRRTIGNEYSPSVSPRRERNVQSPTRTGRSSSPTNPRSNTLVKPKALSVETDRKVNNKVTVNRGRNPPVHSPKNPMVVNNSSPRNKRSTPVVVNQKEKITTIVNLEDESSSISGSSITTSTDTERWKVEQYKDGRNILERCDKLLRSISEMGGTEAQPSPVSVLDSSFYKDESLTPSPVTTKRNIDFKDLSGEFEDEAWSPMISPVRSKRVEIIDDCDFVYISDILRAFDSLPGDSDLFLLLEKQQYLKGNDTSKVSRMQRKLIFDTIIEILERNRRLPPWKAVSWAHYDGSTLSLEKVWLEFQRIRERENADDLFEIICGVLKKDLAGDAVTDWAECPVEMSESVLDIERLIFKDLIGDAIRDLGELASTNTLSYMMPRRKLVF